MKLFSKELSQNKLCFYTALLNAFRAACSLHTCRYAPHKQLENQIKIFGENSKVYFVPVSLTKTDNLAVFPVFKNIAAVFFAVFAIYDFINLREWIYY